ncbi:MAG: hypothetical protein KDJ19_05590 [Hyphomicrobiaceae bacterium]|nr:hypothetical protein [Hyphomicrobiaceae bacterium]MCC0024531.1 hypothetical protein [Hyphomicrobiaceae bacterium]
MTKRLIALLTAGTLIAAGAGAATALPSDEQVIDEGPLTCNIETNMQGRSYVIEAKVASTEDMAGTFRFVVDGGANGGRTHIQQGGGFFAPAGEPIVIGRMQLGSNNAHYELTLDLDTEIGSKSCSVVLGL